MSGPLLGGGDVDVQLGYGARTQVVTLKPTLEACIAISRLAGGLNAAVQRCHALDFDTICAVVQIGIGRAAKEVEELVFLAGTFHVAPRCVQFITIVGNGGREPEPAEDRDEEDPPAGG